MFEFFVFGSELKKLTKFQQVLRIKYHYGRITSISRERRQEKIEAILLPEKLFNEIEKKTSS